jgi:hypothetical protein
LILVKRLMTKGLENPLLLSQGFSRIALSPRNGQKSMVDIRRRSQVFSPICCTNCCSMRSRNWIPDPCLTEVCTPYGETVQRDFVGTHDTIHSSSDASTLNKSAVICWIAHHNEELAPLWELVDPHTISLSFMSSTNAARPTSVMQARLHRPLIFTASIRYIRRSLPCDVNG